MDRFLKAFLCEPIHKIKVTWYMHHPTSLLQSHRFYKAVKICNIWCILDIDYLIIDDFDQINLIITSSKNVSNGPEI